jgi:hypothetical protein
MAIKTEFIKKSQEFVPTDEKGGWLYWSERVTRPGFRMYSRFRTIRKEYFVAPVNMDDRAAACYGDSQIK